MSDDANDNPLGLMYTERFDKTYWDYNVPIQLLYKKGKGHTVLNYLPRKGDIVPLKKYIKQGELTTYCENAAKIYRKLAEQFDKLASENPKGSIEYPAVDYEEE